MKHKFNTLKAIFSIGSFIVFIIKQVGWYPDRYLAANRRSFFEKVHVMAG